MIARHNAMEVAGTVLDRLDVLERFLDGPVDKRTLEDEVDVSRSTIDRAVRELEAIGLVEFCSEGYRLTPVGELVTRQCTDILDTVAVGLEFEEFFRWLPPGEFDLDVRALSDAELLVAESANPYAMINRHVRRVEEADRGRAILPLVGLHAYEAAHENVVEHGAETELVVEPAAADVLVSDPSFEPLTTEMLRTDRFELSVYDGTIPYFVGVFDDEIVQMGVDENGEPRALVETDRDEVLVWAHDTIDEYDQQARELSQAPSRSQVQQIAGE